jgi:hypothetical protein
VTALRAPRHGRPGRWQSGWGRDYYADDMAARDQANSSTALGREALAYADTLYNLARYLTGSPTRRRGPRPGDVRPSAHIGGVIHARHQLQGVAFPHPPQQIHLPNAFGVGAISSVLQRRCPELILFVTPISPTGKHDTCTLSDVRGLAEWRKF